MPNAARVGDVTTHGGMVTGPGIVNVLVGGKPAAVMADMHVCAIPPNTPHATVSIFPMGSPTVLIGGRFALRVGDMCLCGASVIIGEPTVQIGG